MKQCQRSRRRTSAPQARYTNYFEVGHNALEFIVDFGQYHPETTTAQCHTRIVTGPVYAKLLARLLTESIQHHETEHGAIAAADDDFDPLEHVRKSIASFEVRRSGRGGPPRQASPDGRASSGHDGEQ
jgi:hypothetical protein